MMSLKELKKYLTHRVPFPDREFDALMKKGKEMRFKARMPIIKTGDVDENVYIVRDGMVRGVFFANGRENTIYFAFPGDFVASTASLSLGLPAQITMEAFFETVVTVIPMAEFLKMAERSPVFMRWMTEWFLGQIWTIERKRTILAGDASERYDALILRRPELIQQVPIKAIASYLGIAETSLSRLRNPKNRSSKKTSK